MAEKYRVFRKSERKFDAGEDAVDVMQDKADNTALLAEALQDGWEPRTTSEFRKATRRRAVPAGYEKRSKEAVYWIKIHCAAIGEEAFAAKDFKSLAGDLVSRFV